MPNCELKFKQLCVPKWYHHLTPTQAELLEKLLVAASDDIFEGSSSRRRCILRQLNLFPTPSSSDITTAIRKSGGSVVLMLSQLLNSMRGKGGNTRYYNEKLLKSCICYYELPLLLICISKSLTRLQSKTTKTGNTPDDSGCCVKKRGKRNKSSGNPYLQPVWCGKVTDWLSERKAAEEAGVGRSRLTPPDELYRETFPSSHIYKHPQKNEDVLVCHVEESFKEGQKPLQRKRYLNVDELDADFPMYDDVEEAILGVSKYLAQWGMLCCKYSRLQCHPVLQQYMKYVKNEKMTDEIKKQIVDGRKSNMQCIRWMYDVTSLPPCPYVCFFDSSWQNIEAERLNARQTWRRTYNDLFRQRYEAGQKFVRTQLVEYKETRGFLPVSAAYTINYHTDMTVWPSLH